jgi:DUF917 family protein
MTIQNKEELNTILLGACFLASGGGGPLSLGQNLLNAGIKDEDKFELNIIDPSDIEPDQWLVTATGMGIPSADYDYNELNNSVANAVTIFQNWLKSGENLDELKSFPDLENFTEFTNLLPFEIGVVNSILPIIATIILNKNRQTENKVSVINADLGGRSLPTLPLSLLNANGLPFFPNCISAGMENPPYAFVDSNTIDDLQTMFEIIFTSKKFQNSAGTTYYPMKAKTLQSNPNYFVPNTLKDALEIGKLVIGIDDINERVEKIVDYLLSQGRETKEIFTGKISDIKNETVNGHDLDHIIIQGDNIFQNKVLKLTAYNENMFASLEEASSTSEYIEGPDSISFLLDLENSSAIDDRVADVTKLVELFNQGADFKVRVLGIEASENIRTNVDLLNSWSEINKSLGGTGIYSQKWLEQ